MKSPTAKTSTAAGSSPTAIVREVVTRRLRCPSCESDKLKIDRTEPRDGFGNQTRYVRCLDCGQKFHWRETDD